jgi:hypothetical protein
MKMARCAILSTLTIVSLLANAQNIVHNKLTDFFGGLDSYTAMQRHGSGYVVTGSTGDFVLIDSLQIYLRRMFVTEIDEFGDLVDTLMLGQSPESWTSGIKGLAPAHDGGWIVALNLTNYYDSANSAPNAVLMRLDSDFDTLWTKRFGGSHIEWLYNVIETSDHGFVAVGYRYVSAFVKRAYGIRVDSLGELVWEKYFDYGAGESNLNYVIETADRGFLMAGYRDRKAAIIKVDSAGDSPWLKTYGNGLPKGGFFWGGVPFPDGTFIAFGADAIPPGAHFNHFQAYLVKLDLHDSGRIIWEKRFGSPDRFDTFMDGLSVSDTRLAVASSWHTDSFAIDRTALYFLDTSGAVETTRQYEFPEMSYQLTYDLEQTLDGGFIMAGFGNLIAQPQDAWLLKTDCEGNPCHTIGCDSITYTACTPLTVTSLPLQQLEFSVAPNPARDVTWLTIWLSNRSPLSSTLKAEIVDLNGRVVHSRLYPGFMPDIVGRVQLPLQVSDLPGGLYVVTVRDPDGVMLGGEMLVVQ